MSGLDTHLQMIAALRTLHGLVRWFEKNERHWDAQRQENEFYELQEIVDKARAVLKS